MTSPGYLIGKDRRATQPIDADRCIDCDGSGFYPSGARCKSCGGTGCVAKGDGEPIDADRETAKRTLSQIPMLTDDVEILAKDMLVSVAHARKRGHDHMAPLHFHVPEEFITRVAADLSTLRAEKDAEKAGLAADNERLRQEEETWVDDYKAVNDRAEAAQAQLAEARNALETIRDRTDFSQSIPPVKIVEWVHGQTRRVLASLPDRTEEAQS